MPQITRKRRSEAISRDASPSPSQSPEPQQSTQRHVRQRSSSESSVASAASSAVAETQAETQRKTLVKKLIRLALANEYARQPLRRTEISAKVFKDSAGEGTGGGAHSAGSFKKIFAEAQIVLRNTFGMELQELPSKEKTGINDRRKQATQTQKASAASSNRSWILVSVLPKEYKTNRQILEPNHAPSQEVEAGYTGFYTFVVSLVYLCGGEIAEQKLERYLKRVNAESQTIFGSWEKVKARLVREGYLDKKKDSSGGEEVISYVVGPRGKMEVGTKGAEGLVKSVYGQGAAGPGSDGQPKMEMDELTRRLKRSLGESTVRGGGEGAAAEAESNNGASAAQSRNATPQPPAATQQRRRGRPRAAREDDDDD